MNGCYSLGVPQSYGGHGGPWGNQYLTTTLSNVYYILVYFRHLVQPTMSTLAGSVSASKLSALPTYTSVSRSRLHSLYSDFSPQKQSNPAGFQSNVDWWRRTLLHLLTTPTQPSSPDVLVLHADPALLDGFRCEDLGVGKPLGMGSVIVSTLLSGSSHTNNSSQFLLGKTDLSSSHILIPLPTFQATTQSIYYAGSLPLRVASYLVGRPLWWALEQLSIVGDGASRESEENRWKSVQGDYVVVPLLEVRAIISAKTRL